MYNGKEYRGMELVPVQKSSFLEKGTNNRILNSTEFASGHGILRQEFFYLPIRVPGADIALASPDVNALLKSVMEVSTFSFRLHK